MAALPIFLNAERAHVLIVGTGEASMAKLALVAPYGMRLRLVGSGMAEALEDAGLTSERLAPSVAVVHDRDFTARDLDEISLVYASLDDDAAERAIAGAAAARGIPVNIVDRPALGTFITPAQFTRGPLQVAFSSGGVAPVFVRRLRALLEQAVPPALGTLASAAGKAKAAVKTALPDATARRQFWDSLFDQADRFAGLDADTAQSEIEHLARTADTGGKGLVQLVGAGPGDPDLLTMRAHRALQQADVVLYDRLVSKDVLSLARRDAKLVYVGKKEGQHGKGQPRIHALMIEHAREGLRVVRLKSGDPLMFARAGEELAALRGAGIDTEVVPGITALTGIAAAAQIPLTDRQWSSSLTLVTGHCQHGDFSDWARLSGDGQTLAVYMGIKTAPKISAGLIHHGVAAHTPVAVIENGTRPEERRFYGTLATLPQLITEHSVISPALLLIGDVVRTARDWPQERFDELARALSA